LKRCDLYDVNEEEARTRLQAFITPASQPKTAPFPTPAKPSPPQRSVTPNSSEQTESARKNAQQPYYYVSYAWGDITPEGKQRELIVDQICASACDQGINILRDKTTLGVGDRISNFMRKLGQGDRIFVILSDKYLNRHSPDDSETSVESSDFAASLEARREIWLATSSSRSPNDGRGVDLAIFSGIWTHSSCRLRLNA
jgi:hypothetical protein